MIVTTTTPTLLRVSTRQLSPTRALAERAIRVQGDRAAFSRFTALFELPAPDVGGQRR